MSKIHGIPVATPFNPKKVKPDGYATEEYVNQKIEEADFSDKIPESVLQYTPQDLTEEQKAQARKNLGITDTGVVPVQSVNGKTGDVSLTAADVKARPDSWMPTASDVGALPSSTVIPTVPTKVSAFTNDAGYLTQHQDISHKANKQGLSLGVGGDGLVYLFVDGSAQGNGLDIKAEAVAGDVVGYVDDNNNIIITGALADGTYTFKYEDDEGKTTDIGRLQIGDAPTYTNQLDEAGYQTGHRLSSSGDPSAVTGTNPTFITGYIRVDDQQTVRLKNCFIDVDGINGASSADTTAYYGKGCSSLMITLCNSSKGVLNTIAWSGFASSEYFTDVVKDSNGHVTQFKINRSGIVYIRLTLGGDAPDAILTLDQLITD